MKGTKDTNFGSQSPEKVLTNVVWLSGGMATTNLLS